MTPSEFKEICSGFEDRRRMDDERTAGFVCVIANACGHLKRPINVEQLIGKNPKAKRNKDALAEQRAKAKAFAKQLTKKMQNSKEA